MKGWTLLLLCLLSCSANAQGVDNTRYFVTAKKGLICRSGPSPDSLRIGKLPYGATVRLWEKSPVEMEIQEGEHTLHGFWWNVGVGEFHFMYNTFDSYSAKDHWTQIYVFSGYLERLNKGKVYLHECPQKEFLALKMKGESGKWILPKITGLDSIREALQGRLTWTNDPYSDNLKPDSLFFGNGTRQQMNPNVNDCRLEAYYPKEDILLFKCGHESDFSISLRTGETTETVGNPNFIRESPQGKMRLNAIDYGHGCIIYFLQEMKDGVPTYFCDFENQRAILDGMCWFDEFYWITETAFIFSFEAASFNDSPDSMKYYWGEMVRD